MPVGVVTGASRGLGLALSRELARRGWRLVVDARGAAELELAARELGGLGDVVAPESTSFGRPAGLGRLREGRGEGAHVRTPAISAAR